MELITTLGQRNGSHIFKKRNKPDVLEADVWCTTWKLGVGEQSSKHLDHRISILGSP